MLDGGGSWRQSGAARSAVAAGTSVWASASAPSARTLGGRVRGARGVRRMDAADRRSGRATGCTGRGRRLRAAAGAAELLARPDGFCEAFRVGRAVGVQFHPEIDCQALDGWYAAWGDVLSA